MRTAYVNGRHMTPAEVSDYVFETRGYRIDRNTVAKRMRGGLSGEVLLSKPRNSGPRKKRQKPVDIGSLMAQWK